MNGRLALNLLLAVLLAGTVAFVAFGPDPGDADPRTAVSNLDPASITRIELRNHAGQYTQFQRSADHWRLAPPLDLAANRIKIARLLAIASASSLEGFKAAGNDLGQFGLDPPQAELFLNDTRFALGRTEPLDGRRYLLHNGQVHLVEDGYFQLLNADAPSFVDPSPLGPQARLTALTLPEGSMHWDGRVWQSSGLGDPGADWFKSVAERWATAQAVVVRPFSEDAQWSGKITVQIETQTQPFVFEFRWTQHELVLARRDRGIQYHMLRRAMEPIMTSPGSAS